MGFSAWVKADPETILRRHVVDAKGLYPALREASARRRNHLLGTNRLTEQRRLSVFNWNPGPRRGKEGAIDRHLVGKWHITDLRAGQSKRRRIWTCVTRCHFRRQPRNGQKFFTIMSLHINNQYAKKHGIGKKLLLTIRAESSWTCLLGTSTGPFGANQMVTAPTNQYSRGNFCRHKFANATRPHTIVGPRGSAKLDRCVWFWSSPRTRVTNGRFVCMELSQFSASVQKTRIVIMKYGTKTLLAINVLMSHE